MNDAEAIQGLWRLVSIMFHANPVGTGATHYLVRAGEWKEIWPSQVDTGSVRVTYELDDREDAPRITLSYFFANKEVFPTSPKYLKRGVYQLTGDDLTICWGSGDEFPTEFSDEHSIYTLKRDHGPISDTRKPSGKKPLQDDMLGTLMWDDNLNWYQGEFILRDSSVPIYISEANADHAKALGKAKKIVGEIAHYDQAAKQYAAEQLLDLAGDWVYEAEQRSISEEEFISRITLESIHAKPDGGVSFGYADGGIFWGHWIGVEMDADDIFINAEMAG